MSPATTPQPRPATAWLFPGQGSQSVGMARELLAGFAPARELLAQASALCGSELGPVLARGPEALLARTDLLQPALTVVNLGCCLLLRDAGLAPDAVAGHSLGEFAALFAAGVLDADSTLRLVVARGALMHHVAQGLQGGMLAVKGAGLAQLEPLLAAAAADEAPGGAVVVANLNGPSQAVLAGPLAALGRLRVRLGAAGLASVALNVSGPWHSPLMRPASLRFAEHLAATPFAPAQCPVFSNVAARGRRDAALLRQDAGAQLCSPVRWGETLQAMRQAGLQRFVEVGPGKVLRGLLRGHPATADCAVINVDGPRALQFAQGWR